jgi:hypothetical protein
MGVSCDVTDAANCEDQRRSCSQSFYESVKTDYVKSTTEFATLSKYVVIIILTYNYNPICIVISSQVLFHNGSLLH